MGDSTVVRDHPKMIARWGKKKTPPSMASKPIKKLDKEAKKLEGELKRTAKQHTRIRTLTKNKAYTDKDSVKLLLALRAITANMLKRAEKTYHAYGNDRAAYAFNALASQLREIENDLRLVTDLTQQYEKVVDIFVSAFRDLAKDLSEGALRTKREIINTTKKSKRVNGLVDGMMHDVGARMEFYLQQMEKDLHTLMVEPVPSKLIKPRKKRGK